MISLIGAALVIVLELHLEQRIPDILDWINRHKVWGGVSFVLLNACWTGATTSSLLHGESARSAC